MTSLTKQIIGFWLLELVAFAAAYQLLTGVELKGEYTLVIPGFSMPVRVGQALVAAAVLTVVVAILTLVFVFRAKEGYTVAIGCITLAAALSFMAILPVFTPWLEFELVGIASIIFGVFAIIFFLAGVAIWYGDSEFDNLATIVIAGLIHCLVTWLLMAIIILNPSFI